MLGLLLAALAWADPSGEAAMDALRRGTELRATGQHAAAEQAYLRAVEHGATVAGWTEVGTTRAWSGDTAGALRAYAHALEADPEARGASEGTARVLAWHGRTGAARRAWRERIQRDADDAGAWVGLGDAEIVASRPGAARRAFERAESLQPGHPGIAGGLERADGLRTTHGGVDVGVLVDGSGTGRPTGRAGVVHAFGDGWQAAGEARLAVAVGSGTAEVGERVQPAMEAAVSHRGRVLTPQIGAGFVGGSGGGPSAVVGLDARLAEGVVAGVSARPGWSPAGARLGGDARIEVALSSASWTMLRGFAVLDAGEGRVAGIGAALGTQVRAHELRFDAGWVALPGEDLLSGGVAWTPPWRAGRVRPRFATSWLVGRFTQAGGSVGVVF